MREKLRGTLSALDGMGKDLGFLAGAISLGLFAAASFMKGEAVLGSVLVCLAVMAFRAFTEWQVERAKGEQAMKFVGMLVSGNDTTVTVDVKYLQIKDAPHGQ